jgi:AraC-like DNA-binding protein
MRINSIQPPPSISAYVNSIFVMEDCQLQDDVGLPLIANGYPGIVFQTSDSTVINSENKKSESLTLYGQTVKPIKLYTPGRLTLIAYFLYPSVLKSLSRFSAVELTDISIDLNQLKAAREINLKEQLINTVSLSARLQLLNAYVLKLSEASHTGTDRALHFATQTIRKSNGVVSLQKVRDELQLSERTFRRLFDFHVGVSPKMFSRICQFNAAFQQLSQNDFSRLGDIAYDNGYADQSHLIRAFKEFTTCSPGAYLKNMSAFQRLNS